VVGGVGLLALVGVVGVFVLVWWTMPPTYANDVYRIAPGDYELMSSMVGEGGVTASEKVALIPSTRIAQANLAGTFPEIGWYATAGITVERIEEGKEPEIRSFEKAAGMASWLRFEPVSDRLARVKVVHLTENLTDTGRRARYILHVPKNRPAIISASSSAVKDAESRITGRTGAVKGMQRVDEYAARLRKVFGTQSGVVGEFAEKMRPVEDGWLTGRGDPGELVERQIDAFEKSVSDSDPREALYLLSVVHGDALTPDQIAGARKLFAAPIAEGYAAARPADLAALLFCLVADHQGEFEKTVRVLHWVTESVRGPIIIREWDIGNTHYIEYLIEFQKGKEFRQYVVEKYRSQSKGLPAATRLLNAIKSAAGEGPISIQGEHVYNLDYPIDMQAAPAGANRTEDGYQRNSQWFWEQLLQRHPELFDEENRKLIKEMRPPIVNDRWLKYFPKHAGYRRQKLRHHHLGRGPLAVPIPEKAHAKYRARPEK
jgi:hypothetical protein